MRRRPPESSIVILLVIFNPTRVGRGERIEDHEHDQDE